MTRYPTAQAQRARHLLNREALKRSHRRGDLIRILPDLAPDSPVPSPVGSTEIVENPATTPHS